MKGTKVIAKDNRNKAPQEYFLRRCFFLKELIQSPYDERQHEHVANREQQPSYDSAPYQLSGGKCAESFEIKEKEGEQYGVDEYGTS